MFKNVLFILLTILLLSFFSCTFLNEDTIDGEYELVSILGINTSSWIGIDYKFDDGDGYTKGEYDLVYDKDFEYTMSGNVIKIENINTSGLADGKYYTYKYNNQMIWYYYSTWIECYRFNIK